MFESLKHKLDWSLLQTSSQQNEIVFIVPIKRKKHESESDKQVYLQLQVLTLANHTVMFCVRISSFHTNEQKAYAYKVEFHLPFPFSLSLSLCFYIWRSPSFKPLFIAFWCIFTFLLNIVLIPLLIIPICIYIIHVLYFWYRSISVLFPWYMK